MTRATEEEKFAAFKTINELRKELKALQEENAKMREAIKNLLNKSGRDIRFLNSEAWNQLIESVKITLYE